MSNWLADIFDNHLWLIGCTAILIALIVISVLSLKLRNIANTRAAKSESSWDDIWIYALYAPAIVLLWAFGVGKMINIAIIRLPQDNKFKEYADTIQNFQELIFTVTIFWFFWRLVSAIERHFRDNTLKISGKKIDSGTAHAIFRIARAMVLLFAALTLMEALGVSLSGILAFGGIGGIIIGLAAQNTLSNFFSGMVIFVERPFVVGDWIRCPNINVEGVVEDIGWRMTQIKTFDHRPLYVPNSLFSANVIENPQRMTNRRIYEYIGLRYNDIDKIEAILADVKAMLKTHHDIDQEKIIMASFDRYGASSVDFFIYVMTSTTKWSEFHESGVLSPTPNARKTRIS